jgi:glycosyltransferase involved in cell wall biosynthesis
MGNPKVSIVIPAYNHERYVGEAIRSVLDQTFQDFELIIINDGSTDNTEAEILKFKDDRIRYSSQGNRGLSATLNRGIDLARGEYFGLLPSDDLYIREKVETQVKAFQERGNALGILFSRQIIIDAQGNDLLEGPIIDWFNVPYKNKEEIFPALFEKNFLAAPTMMCKKECFDKVGGFDESIYYCQDYDMWLRMMKYYDVRVLDQALIKYRWHGENLTYAKSERADFERAVLLLRAVKNLDISDIFPRLKDLQKADHGPLYVAAYRDLAERLIKSGLIELIPVAYVFMEEARKLGPGLEIKMEMEKLISQRPHFLDLRDQRLGLLSQEASELREKLYYLQKLHEVLSEDPRMLLKQAEEFEKQKEELRRKTEEFEEKKEQQEREFFVRVQEVDEREQSLHRWQTELLATQVKWDAFVRKPWTRALRFVYKILKSAWRVLPEKVRGPVRARLKERLQLPSSPKQEIPIKPANRFKDESGARQDFSPIYGRADKTYLKMLGQGKLPKVSIVLPIYNQSHLAEKAIKSVLKQTYPNLELIIVNDGSTDRLSEILPRYGFHDKIMILNQENQGLPRALTNGFRHATGTFFTWTSADNIMLPRQVETLVEFLMRHPDVDMVFSNVEIIDEAGNPVLNSNYRRHNQRPPGSNKIFLPHEVATLGTVDDNFINASFLYRSSVGKAVGEYDPCLLGTEDYDYWLRINSLFTLRHLDSDEILYQYRVHDDSLSERFGKSDIFENAKTLIRYHSERESYYDKKFDIVILGNRNQDRENRMERLALEFRNQGHQVIWGTFDAKKAGQHRKEGGMVEVFLEEGDPIQIKESLFKHRQYFKALVILTAPLGRNILGPMRTEDTFFCLDSKSSGLSETVSVEPVDAITLRSQSHLKRLSKTFTENIYLVEDGIIEKRILKKARGNFYRPFGDSIGSERTLLYYGPLIKDFFNQVLFDEFVREREDWNVLLVGIPGKADKHFVSRLCEHGGVKYLGEKPCDENGNLYQILSGISFLWAPVLMPAQPDDIHEELIQRMIEIAAFSGRPILIPEGLDFSEIPFVFQFKDAKDCADLLDRLALLEVGQEIFDRWISHHTWDEKTRRLIGIANNALYYRKTREPIKKTRHLFTAPPSVYCPDKGKSNVLIQVRSLDKGGLEEVVLNLISHLDYKKVNVLILCEERKGVIADQCKGVGIMVKNLGGEKEGEYKEILRKYSIGAVNCHYATFGMNIAHEMGIPVLPVIHNTYAWFHDHEIAYFKSCDRYVSKYIAVSENVARYTSMRFNIPREKIRVIPNGLDVLKHEAMMARGITMDRASFGVYDEGFLFLNIASYDGRKGHHALLSAMKKVRDKQPGIKVLCVGNIADPQYYTGLKARVSKEGLEKEILLHDYVENVSSLYPIADAFILTSLIEGWSISVMEAMFYGLPLILTDAGSNGEIINKVENGILVPSSYGDLLRLDQHKLGRYCTEEEPENSEPLARAILDFHARKDYWKEKGQRGKEAVTNIYRIENTAKAYEDVFLQFARKGLKAR